MPVNKANERTSTMGKSVRLADIAAELGVSIVTVSKALSGQKGVGEELRQKIIALADEMGYKLPSSDSSSRSTKTQEGYTIGVIIHEKYLDSRDSFYIKLYQEIVTKAISLGTFVSLQVISEVMEESLEIANITKGVSFDGLIILGRFNNEYYEKLVSSYDIPMINTDFYSESVNPDSVISDNFYGAYRITNYLFEKGHTKIAYVGSINETDSIMDRFMGYSKSILQHGCTVREDWIIPDWDKEGMHRLQEFDLPEEMPTAFFCNNDMVAGNLINQLESMGLSIPEDISVVGYDNFIYTGICDVEITTYEVDLKEMAHKSVNGLIKKIQGDGYRPGMRIVQGRLIEKDSVRKID